MASGRHLHCLRNHGNFDVFPSDEVTLVLCSDKYSFIALLDLAIDLRSVLKARNQPEVAHYF